MSANVWLNLVFHFFFWQTFYFFLSRPKLKTPALLLLFFYLHSVWEVKNLVFLYICMYAAGVVQSKFMDLQIVGPATIRHRRKLTKLANYVKCKLCGGGN